MSTDYMHRFLRCPNGHEIPLPPALLVAADGSRPARAKASVRAVFACTECGDVSAYLGQDVRMEVRPTLDPHRSGRVHLRCIEPMCDGKHCEAPRQVYMLGSGPEAIGELRMIVRPKDWKFAETATCEAGHRLYFQKDGEPAMYVSTWCDSPF